MKFLKPLLLREKFISKDDKLLRTFKKITEINATKMTEKPDFILTTTSNLEGLKKETLSTEEPKLKIIVHRPSQLDHLPCLNRKRTASFNSYNSNFEDVRF
jgi:hypothetical protein